MRNSRFILIIGYNGTGKSTFCKKLVTKALTSKRRVLIVMPDLVEWNEYPTTDLSASEAYHLRGAARTAFEDHTLESLQNFHSGLLVFDDCRAYINSSTERDLRSLLIRRRQRQIDIVAVGHGFTEIPPTFFTFASEIVLFNTKDNINKRKGVLKDFDAMVQHQTEVNYNAKTNPYFYRIIKQ